MQSPRSTLAVLEQYVEGGLGSGIPRPASGQPCQWHSVAQHSTGRLPVRRRGGGCEDRWRVHCDGFFRGHFFARSSASAQPFTAHDVSLCTSNDTLQPGEITRAVTYYKPATVTVVNLKARSNATRGQWQDGAASESRLTQIDRAFAMGVAAIHGRHRGRSGSCASAAPGRRPPWGPWAAY